MSNLTQSQIVSLYFQSFCRRDCASLEVLFSDTVMLTSWNAQIVGRDNLLASNQKFFDSFKSLRIDVEKIALGQDTIMAEIRIVIDDNITAQVVDVFDFDQDNKIKAIRAYKR